MKASRRNIVIAVVLLAVNMLEKKDKRWPAGDPEV